MELKQQAKEDKIFYVAMDKENKIYATTELDLKNYKTNDIKQWDDGPGWLDRGWNDYHDWIDYR